MREVLIPPASTTRSIRPPAAGQIVHTLAGETMGTTWCVKLAGPPGGCAQRLEPRVQLLFDRVVAQMSPWREDSDLCRYNRAPAGTWVPLPGEMFAVLAFALEVARATGGAYDPAVGALVNGWGFGPSPGGGALPDRELLRSWRMNCGWRRVQLDHGRRLARQDGGVLLDLCSIAKGFAVDLVARELDRLGCDSYLVEAGGELRGRGVKPDSSPWWVELETPPDAAGRLSPAIVALAGISIATSGDYRCYFDAGGRRYAHTIDPHAGCPVQNNLASVTVMTGECMAADAWSTALTVMGVEQGLALAERLGLAARFVCRADPGWTVHTSPSYDAMLD